MPIAFSILFLLALACAEPDPAPIVLKSAPPENPLTNRDRKKRERVLREFGGSHKTERAVADGLAWLAAHQRPDGIWDRRHFDQLCPAGDRCSQTALNRTSKDANIGVSALAALAFLGAGYTHEDGRYADQLSRVFSYILAQQDTRGSFSAGSGLQLYNDAIAALAIAEAYAVTKDPILREPLERVIRHLAACQQAGGGWDYTDNLRSGRNDTSISSWVLMALKSAQAAGVQPPVSTRFRLLAHFDRATDRRGRVWYADKGIGTETTSRGEVIQYRYGPAMLATGLFSRAAFGLRLDDADATKQINAILAEAPSLDALRKPGYGLHNEYYWYYGTLALFNVGGEPWQRWNAALRSTVLEYQERPVKKKSGRKRHSYGSWPAFGRGWGKWGRSGGRIYSTAINTLTLEIYYRYVPAFLSPRGILGPTELRERLAGLATHEHDQVLKLALRLHPDTGEPVLLDLLESRNMKVRLGAAVGLASLDSPMGALELQRQRETGSMKSRRAAGRALTKIQQIKVPTSYGQVTETNSQVRMFLFDTKDQPVYYGQRVHVLRGGEVIGVAHVNRRFSAHGAAAARLAADAKEEVKVGDVIKPDPSAKMQGSE